MTSCACRRAGAAEVGRDQFALVVVVAGVVGDEHLEPVADRDPRGDDQESLGEPRIAGARHLVGGLPGDEHRHHHCLAGAGRHLERNAREPGVVVGVGVVEPAPPVGIAVSTGDLGQEDRGFRCLALAVEYAVLPGRVGPVLEQLSRRRRDPLVVAVPPSLDLAAQVVDQRVALAALAGQLDVKAGLDRAVRLLGAFPAGRDGDQRLARASAFLDHAGWAMWTELEVADRYVVRPIQDRVGEHIYGSVLGAHRSSSLPTEGHSRDGAHQQEPDCTRRQPQAPQAPPSEHGYAAEEQARCQRDVQPEADSGHE